MKKRFISTGLLKNSISRIFVLTLIFTVGETAIAALMSFTFALGTGEGGRMLYDFYTMNPLASGLMIFAVPILTVNEFSYLTNRAGADFFDALPHTRTSVAVCGIGAVAISVLARLTVSTLTSVVMTLVLCHKTIAISFSSVIVPYLSVLTASLLLAVICALACSITGTTANALMVTFLIAAGPRIVMSLTNFAISGNLPVLMDGKVLPLFDNSYNLLTMLVGSLGTVTVTLKAFIYTLILISVYLFLAIFAYNKRKSEYASRSAPGKLANHIYRISLASFISICAITLAFSIGFDLVVVVLFVISLIVYFAYELIANKSVRGLPAAAAWLPVFVAVNLLFAAVIGLGSAAFKAYSPDAEKIKYVSVVTDGSGNYVDLPEYAFLVAQDARLEDGKVKKIISSSLEENLEELEKGTYYITYTNRYYKTVNVKIKSGLFSAYRSIYVTNEDYDTIMSELAKNEEYRNAWTDLPENPEMISAFHDAGIYFEGDDAADIYRTLREEIRALGYDKWVELYGESSYEDRCGNVNFDVKLKGKTYTLTLYVPKALTKTAAKLEHYAELETKQQVAKIKHLLSDVEDDLYISISVSIDGDYYSLNAYYSELENPEQTVEFIKSLMTEQYADYSSDDDLVDMYFSELYARDSYVLCCKLNPNITVEQIKKYFND